MGQTAPRIASSVYVISPFRYAALMTVFASALNGRLTQTAPRILLKFLGKAESSIPAFINSLSVFTWDQR